MMKKVLAVLLALSMIFSFAACGEKKAEAPAAAGPLKDLYDQGFDYTSAMGQENIWAGIYQKEEDDRIYAAKVTIPQAQMAEFEALDWGDEDFPEKMKAFLMKQQDVEIIDLADYVPQDGFFDSYIGKTFGDLENEGYEDMGYWLGEDKPWFYYDGPQYCISVSTDLDIPDSDAMDAYSPNDIRGFVITGVEYLGFSTLLLENL